MSDPNYKLCDICKAQLDIHTRLHIAIDRSMDAAGSMDTQYEILDLCDKHKAAAILFLLKSDSSTKCPDYELGYQLLRWANEQKSK